MKMLQIGAVSFQQLLLLHILMFYVGSAVSTSSDQQQDLVNDNDHNNNNHQEPAADREEEEEVATEAGPPTGEGGPEPEHGNYPLRCLMRQFNFTATVTDANGKQCRGQVSTKACFGSCDSYEVGTFEFPWIVRVQPVCNYEGVAMKEARLRDCDPGVDTAAFIYRFPEANGCSCSICDPKEQACEATPTKRNEKQQSNSLLSKIIIPKKRSDPPAAQSGISNFHHRTIKYRPYFDENQSAWVEERSS